MTIKYFGCVILLSMPCVVKPMQAHFSTMISFNGEEKTLYEWIRNDSRKEFGYTSIVDLHKTSGSGGPQNRHYRRENRVSEMTDEQLKDIADGLYIYCKNIKIRKINSKKINYGVLALAFGRTRTIITNTSESCISSVEPLLITSEMINEKSNLLYFDCLKKANQKKNKVIKDKKLITS